MSCSIESSFVEASFLRVVEASYLLYILVECRKYCRDCGDPFYMSDDPHTKRHILILAVCRPIIKVLLLLSVCEKLYVKKIISIYDDTHHTKNTIKHYWYAGGDDASFGRYSQCQHSFLTVRTKPYSGACCCNHAYT